MAANPLSPGFREGSRWARRQVARLRLWGLGRQLAKAETVLGLLGWQQVDFDPETERQVQEIQEVEREQTRLTNEAASRGEAWRSLRAQMDEFFRLRFEGRKQLALEERRLHEPRLDLEARLAEKRKIEPNFERRMPELDRELREVTKLVSELLGTEHLNLKMRQELTRLRERGVAIPNEKNDLRTQHLRTVSEIRAMEESLAESLQAEAALRERASKAEAAWAAEERALQSKLEEENRQKTKIERRIEELETAKANPYQAIGKVLAASGLAPLNQPQALERVKRLQHRMGEQYQVILEAEAASAREDPVALRHSWVLWSAVLALALLLLFLALR